MHKLYISNSVVLFWKEWPLKFMGLRQLLNCWLFLLDCWTFFFRPNNERAQDNTTGCPTQKALILPYFILYLFSCSSIILCFPFSHFPYSYGEEVPSASNRKSCVSGTGMIGHREISCHTAILSLSLSHTHTFMETLSEQINTDIHRACK